MILAKITNFNKSSYPCLKKFSRDNIIVLFIAPNTGMCVAGNRIGEYSENWLEADFLYFQETITLRNYE